MIEAMPRIDYLDTTMRDGDQAQPQENQCPPGTKPGIAEELAAMGIHTIEAGFPTTPKDAEEVEAVAKSVGNADYVVTPHYIRDNELVAGEPYVHTPVITGLSRAMKGDIEKTWAAVQGARDPGIHTFMATAADHAAVKFPGKSQDDLAEMARAAVAHAYEVSGGSARIEFSAEAATGTDRAFLERIVKTVIQAGADVINLPDTLGQSSPRKIAKLFGDVTRWVAEEGVQDSVTISAHCHNDFGLATANTGAALGAVADTARELGIRIPDMQAEIVVGGRGERAGNASAEQVIMSIQKHADEFGDGIRMPEVDITRIMQATRHVFGVLGMEIPPTAPIIGVDTHTHRSGIHSAAVVAGGARIYTPYDPRWVGHNEAAIIAPGGYQGRRGADNLGQWQTY
jgi:2-isopropylmalate synthase